MSLQCPKSFQKNYQKWYIMDELLNVPPGNTVIAPLRTSQRKFQMSHLGTPGVLSLGKFKVFPRCSHLGHPGHMTWYIVNVLTILFHRATQEHHGYFLSGNSRYTHGLPNQDITITSLGALWMYWAFPMLGTLQLNCLGKF